METAFILAKLKDFSLTLQLLAAGQNVAALRSGS
jgi:hypothetical protein